MHQQLWGYKVEWKSVSRGTGGKRLNTTDLKHVLSSTARTLGSRVRIPLEAWMCVHVFLCYVVLCRYRPCVGMIPRPWNPTKCP
jgi:hypothetical protein